MAFGDESSSSAKYTSLPNHSIPSPVSSVPPIPSVDNTYSNQNEFVDVPIFQPSITTNSQTDLQSSQSHWSEWKDSITNDQPGQWELWENWNSLTTTATTTDNNNPSNLSNNNINNGNTLCDSNTLPSYITASKPLQDFTEASKVSKSQSNSNNNCEECGALFNQITAVLDSFEKSQKELQDYKHQLDIYRGNMSLLKSFEDCEYFEHEIYEILFQIKERKVR